VFYYPELHLDNDFQFKSHLGQRCQATSEARRDMEEFTVFIYARRYLPGPVNILRDTNEIPKKKRPSSISFTLFNLLCSSLLRHQHRYSSFNSLRHTAPPYTLNSTNTNLEHLRSFRLPKLFTRRPDFPHVMMATTTHSDKIEALSNAFAVS